jgi:hypothetical protein
MSRETITFEYEDENSCEIEHEFPAKYEVCSRCDGRGTHANPSIDGNGITESEMDEILHEDPDFLDNYQGGMYDVICHQCKGLRVELMIDEDAILGSDKHKEAYEAYLLDKKENELYQREVEFERRMGC